MPLSDFPTPLDWGRDLDARWPEREALRKLLVRTITKECERNPTARLLELGIGDGRLLRAVSRQLPQAQVLGVDLEPSLVEHARASLGGCEVDVRNLNDSDWWPAMSESIDLAFSLQTFHDLGGRDELRAVYARILQILAPGGRLLNADFVVPHAQDDPDRPRRFAVSVHETLLKEIGFTDIECLATLNNLACLSARRSG